MSSANVCIPNIGPRQRRRRLNFGVVSVAIGLLVGLALVWLDVPRTWRFAAFVPFWLGAIGVMQAHEKTCVGLFKQGVRNMDSGPERITDEAVLRQLGLQARKVHLKSLALASVLSAALVVIP